MYGSDSAKQGLAGCGWRRQHATAFEQLVTPDVHDLKRLQLRDAAGLPAVDRIVVELVVGEHLDAVHGSPRDTELVFPIRRVLGESQVAPASRRLDTAFAVFC